MMSPIVGCHAVELSDSAKYINRWFVVDEKYEWLKDADLTAVKLSVSFGNLVVRAPGMLRLDIPMDVIEDDESVFVDAVVGKQSVKVVDEGDLAAVWFSNLLGRPCRLVKVHPNVEPPHFEGLGL